LRDLGIFQLTRSVSSVNFMVRHFWV
jgi:hypothetical protein